MVLTPNQTSQSNPGPHTGHGGVRSRRVGEVHDHDGAEADDMATVPIPARRVVSTVDSASAPERMENKPFAIRVARRLVIDGFGLWARFSRALGRRLHWYPKVEPYVCYGTDDYARLICRTTFAPGHSRSGTLMRGLRAMLAVPAGSIHVRIAIDDVPIETVQVGSSEIYDKVDRVRDRSGDYAISDSSGYLDLVAERRLEPGVHTVSYVVEGRHPVHAELFVIAPGTPVGVISDVDDTIMVTNAPSMVKAAYNLLLLNPKKRASVPGMGVFFNRIADQFPNAPFFYLSTSPWNVERTIRTFIDDQGFPEGPLLLRDLDPRPKTFVPSGVQHKLEFAEQLMNDFPNMKFILIGDDGQKDPITYATIAHRHPGRVLAIGLRQLSPREFSPLASVAGRTTVHPMPITDAPVFTGATGANLMKTMMPFLKLPH